jgi:hypothetical protein
MKNRPELRSRSTISSNAEFEGAQTSTCARCFRFAPIFSGRCTSHRRKEVKFASSSTAGQVLYNGRTLKNLKTLTLKNLI